MLSVRCLSVSDVGIFWPNGRMNQDETWHGGRPRPTPHCVRWGPSSPPPQKKGAQPLNFQPMSIVAKQSPISATAEHLYSIPMIFSHHELENFMQKNATFPAKWKIWALQNTRPQELVSWSLAFLFSTNTAISVTKGQAWRAILTQWRKASDILTSTLAASLFSSHPKRKRDREAHLNYYASAYNRGDNYHIARQK